MLGAALLGSALFGAGLALLLELFNKGVRSERQIEALTGIASAGLVPAIKSKPLEIVLRERGSAYSEAIRNIGAGLRIEGAKVVLVTSALPGEGKSVFASSLACSVADDGHRVLLVDCDLRRPNVHRLMNQPQRAGFRELILGQIREATAIVTDPHSSVAYIPASNGEAVQKPSPQDILGSETFKQLLAKWRDQYDLIVLDAPPVLSVSDPLILNRLADTTLLVVRWASTPLAIFEAAARKLRTTSSYAPRVVLSRVDLRSYTQYEFGNAYEAIYAPASYHSQASWSIASFLKRTGGDAHGTGPDHSLTTLTVPADAAEIADDDTVTCKSRGVTSVAEMHRGIENQCDLRRSECGPSELPSSGEDAETHMHGAIHVVVPVHNRRALTERFLECLAKQTLRNFKIVLVDDGSTDGTAELVRDKFPEVVLLRGDGNLWWTGATNLGIRYTLLHASENDAVLIINDDLEVDPNYLERLHEAWRSSPNALIGSVVVELDKPDVVFYGGERLSRWSAKFRWLNSGKRLTEFGRGFRVEVSVLNGMGTLIPVPVFRKIGLYDERHFQQCGDYEFPTRASNHGYSLIVAYDAVVKMPPETSAGINLKTTYTIKDLKSFFFDIKSNYRLKYRIFFAYNIARNPLAFLSYVVCDITRITFHFVSRVRL
jgi:capsular exopolysaccharide synthesis family protein